MIVRAFPRIHVTLIDVAGVTHRRYGGAGFSLDAHPVVVEATLSSSNELTLQEDLDGRDKVDVRSLLERLARSLSTRFAVNVHSVPPQHVGLGSQTALLLAIGAACNALLGNPLKPDDLKRLSGRGGASGVGVNAFFHGGLIIDLGHPESTDVGFVPSSARQVLVSPPIALRLSFPQQWQVHLFLPVGHRYSGDDEVQFFQQNTPIPGEQALRVLAAVYHGIVPALIGNDLPLLKQAIVDIHRTGFKQRELQGQDDEVRYILALLNKHDEVVAGLSSMGPLIYAIAPADAKVMIEKTAMTIQDATRATYLGACNGRNAGHETSEHL